MSLDLSLFLRRLLCLHRHRRRDHLARSPGCGRTECVDCSRREVGYTYPVLTCLVCGKCWKKRKP